MPGIIPSLKAYNAIAVLCEEIYDLSLSLVPPLGPDYYDITQCLLLYIRIQLEELRPFKRF